MQVLCNTLSHYYWHLFVIFQYLYLCFLTFLCVCFFCFLCLFCVLYSMFYSVLCIVSLFVYSCLFLLFAQVFRPMTPGGKLIAVNKYRIISQLINSVRLTLYCLMSQCLLIYYVHISYSIRKVYNPINAMYSGTNFKLTVSWLFILRGKSYIYSTRTTTFYVYYCIYLTYPIHFQINVNEVTLQVQRFGYNLLNLIGQ